MPEVAISARKTSGAALESAGLVTLVVAVVVVVVSASAAGSWTGSVVMAVILSPYGLLIVRMWSGRAQASSGMSVMYLERQHIVMDDLGVR